MVEPTLQAKIAHAQRAYELVVDYLNNREMSPLLPFVEPIRASLATGDPDEIQRQREAVTPKDDSLMEAIMMDVELRARWSLLEESLGAIKMWHRFGVDRAAVDLGPEAVASRVRKMIDAMGYNRPWWQRLFSR